jgi:NAD kinase
MERLTENKIILVTRRTRLDELIARFNTEDQARFYVEHLGADFSDYQAEDQWYKQVAGAAENILSRLGRLQRLDRAYLPNFIFGAQDTVVVLGQDGLVANVLKDLDRQLLVGVNPDPGRWEGVLLPFTTPDLETVLPAVFNGKHRIRSVTMAKATLNSGETLYGVNDLFIGPRSHTSARYTIEIGGRSENHSSSGIIVSTGLGSTGWLRSVLTGATGIASSLSGQKRKFSGALSSLSSLSSRQKRNLENDQGYSFPWDSDYLYFSAREPWPSTTSGAEIVFGKITAESPLTLVSQMPEHGVIFSDGIETDFLKFNSGSCAVITLAERKGQIVTRDLI